MRCSRGKSGRGRLGPLRVLPLRELVFELARNVADDQHIAIFIVLNRRSQMMGFEGDSQAFSTSGKALELLQSPLVRRNFRGQTIVLVPDVVVEGFRSVFVDQARKFVQGYRLPESRLALA